MAAEATIRRALKVLRTGKPGNLYDSIMSNRGELLSPTPESLNNMTKTRSRTWQIRAKRWLQIMPEDLKGMMSQE
jgi:hypothetical protein